jgi:DNA-binding GntR family transcriptional regulator
VAANVVDTFGIEMVTSGVGVSPVPRHAGDHAAAAVHAHLRALILDGVFPPDSELNQVELAPLLGVSRTPLREAIRMLQEEGLVDAQPQKRARVVGFDPSHLEAVYAERVLLEGLGAKLTAPKITEEQLAEIEPLLETMRLTAEGRDLNAWTTAHTHFHRVLMSGASPYLREAIITRQDRSGQYRLLSVDRGHPRMWASSGSEHEDIFDAYAQRDPDAAAATLTAHLARTALWLIAQISPTYDPVAVRTALASYHSHDEPCGSPSPSPRSKTRRAGTGGQGRRGTEPRRGEAAEA